MFDKIFVSLQITEKNIYLICLDSKKKKPVKKFKAALPKGIIEKNEVLDKKSLKTIIKGIWDKNKISEKAVSLILPEYTTFTKVVSVPTLVSSELDEAVKWEAQQYPPETIVKLIVDRKIVSKGEDSVKVLLAAIGKKVLSGFVDAAEEAGLFPLSVETPSLSLSRFSGEGNDTGKLIINGNGEEYLFIVSKGETIYGTTISAADSPDTLAKSAVRMCNHYKEADVSEITICGTGISEKLVDSIKSELKIPVNWINPKIRGLSESEIQEYIVSVCTQFSEPEEPVDQFTLNLLPERLVSKYKKEKSRLQLWSLTLTITLFVWISLLLTVGSYVFLNAQLAEISAKNAKNSNITAQRESAIKEVDYINKVAAKIIKLKAISVTPEELINEITQTSQNGVVITRYKFSLDIGRIEFEGIAPNREALLKLKENLEKNTKNQGVEIPISSFEKETNLEFKVTYNYLPISSLTVKKK